MAQSAQEVMTHDPVTVETSAALTDAARLMRELGTGRSAPRSGKARCIVTDRDIVVRAETAASAAQEGSEETIESVGEGGPSPAAFEHETSWQRDRRSAAAPHPALPRQRRLARRTSSSSAFMACRSRSRASSS